MCKEETKETTTAPATDPRAEHEATDPELPSAQDQGIRLYVSAESRGISPLSISCPIADDQTAGITG